MSADALVRCAWCSTDPLYQAYHDQEWGAPNRNERHLFEMLTLEGAQAGLAWITILRKREGYRRAFFGFDPDAVARFDQSDIARLLVDPGIVRNRLKIESTINNARILLALYERGQDLSDLL
jgi:DNA-3-methyladenine glycosylase I